jgi:hypothetical protein
MNNDMVKLSVSSAEYELLGDIEELGFGEILNVQKDEGPPIHNVLVDGKTLRMLKVLRQAGHFDTITVHESEPVMARKAMKTASGRDCIKNYRF